MSRRDPQWIYWAPYLATMISFTVLAIGFVFLREWYLTAVCCVGVATTGMAWRTNAGLREEITGLEKARVHDAYKISGLEHQLKRERSWRN